jgi:hypothetical protein
MLVSAQNVSVPADGFTTSRVRWYEFDTNGTPSLVQEGTISPGAGVSTYYGAPALDKNGDIGITYMESSSSEYVSMYVAGRLATDELGTMGPGTGVAPGIATNFEFFRTGDYGGMSVDPTDGLTFWAAHEYAGTDFLWNTALASFTIAGHGDEDWYSIAATVGENLKVTLNLPGSSTGAQFTNLPCVGGCQGMTSMRRGIGLRHRRDGDLPLGADLYHQLGTLEERHAEQGDGVRFIDRDPARLAVPDDDPFVNVEEAIGPITQSGAAAPLPSEPELADQRGWQSDPAVEAGVDQDVDVNLLTGRPLNRQSDDRLEIGGDAADDHDPPARRPMPNRRA